MQITNSSMQVALPSQHVGVLSRMVAEAHNELGSAAYFLHTLEPVDEFVEKLVPIEGLEMAVVEGRSLSAKKDVRGFVFANQGEHIGKTDTVLGTTYDAEGKASYLVWMQAISPESVVEEKGAE